MKTLAIARFCWALFRTNLRSVTALRGSFLLSMTFMALNNTTFFVFWWLLFGRIGSLRGWHVQDVELLFGISAAGFGLMQATLGGAMHLARFVDDGSLEPMMVQPKPTLLYALGCRSQASGFGDMASGFVFMILSGYVSWSDAPRALLCVLVSCVAFTAVCVALGSLAFWIKKSETLSRQLLDIVITFSLYPEPLFDGGLKLLLFTLVPAGFVSYLPAEVVRGAGPVALCLMLGGCALLCAASLRVFRAGLRRYAGGSRFGVFG
ncbi:MAG TPA: ABC-2 family transporter protein [Polyangiaceae bacterium]|nr:ABC-2 family transporter protein [Polyangiaceae bacterium]